METRIWKMSWSDGMSVGIPEIDEDHKRFIALVNSFNRFVAERMPLSDVQGKLQEVLDDAIEHFAQEEKLLREWRYPEANGHARIHAQLVKVLQDIKSTICYDYDAEWVESVLKIKEALINHIHTEDMKFAEFYRNWRVASSR